ncbi:conserved hypothetical protein [Cenarchaeum symbiosum A]|uniref:Uncharacterized protein n=1 Tax=Cenarchaeum symbiosum (strain A) TaxID=414004 RepID=A0RWF9_CENSY|nr:conserved hypothetical protein [Cenarchaeum symbiosum A]
MTLEEIMAEKVSAVVYSSHARHVYDISFLHDRGVRINPDMVRAKIRGLYEHEFEPDVFIAKMHEKKKEWIDSLQPFLPRGMVTFDSIAGRVQNIVMDAMD